MDCRLSSVDCRFEVVQRGRSSTPPSSGHRQSTFFNTQWVRRIPLVMAVGYVAFLACSAPRRTWIPLRPADQIDESSFLHYLARVPVVTVDEGARAVLMLIGPTDPEASFEQRWSELERLGAVREGWGCVPEDTLDKGTLAHMLARICKLPIGPNDWVSATLGLGDRRYALRSCVYHGLMAQGIPQDPVTGGELLSALIAAESRIATFETTDS